MTNASRVWRRNLLIRQFFGFPVLAFFVFMMVLGFRGIWFESDWTGALRDLGVGVVLGVVNYAIWRVLLFPASGNRGKEGGADGRSRPPEPHPAPVPVGARPPALSGTAKRPVPQPEGEGLNSSVRIREIIGRLRGEDIAG
jgi:hypothetical protein